MLPSPLLQISRLSLLVLALLCGTVVQAQSTDEQLAAQYYRSGEFDKALLYYERLYSKNPSDENYEYYYGCLLALKQFKDAERVAERQSKMRPGAFRFRVDVGRTYVKAGENDKAARYFDRIIKDLEGSSVNEIIDAGNAFSQIGEDELALRVYYIGRKQLGNAYPFNFQIAQALGQKGDIEGMINEYLDLLEVSEGYLQNVQSTLNRVIGFDETNKYNAVLQQQLMKRIQKQPDLHVYTEMLIWQYVQQSRFESAMAQIKVLDKRTKAEGSRVMDLSRVAMDHYRWDAAIDGYSYVKELGPNNYHYIEAMTGLLRARHMKVVSGKTTEADVAALITEYQNAIAELGTRPTTVMLIKDYAHVKAYYQSAYSPTAVTEAMDILSEALALPNLEPRHEAELKIELADIYVLANMIWDASLLYGQVEKKFKYDEIGHAAKLKNALVFYYGGDFGWAQAQMKVLKGSTSKLISNDALELSAFITENIGIDSNTEALSFFARIELLVRQHKYDSALAALDVLEKNYPSHELADNILFERAQIFSETGRYEEAANVYISISEQYSEGVLADNALMEAGRMFETRLEKKEAAMEAYRTILSDHPGSLYVIEARKRFRTLRGDAVQ